MTARPYRIMKKLLLSCATDLMALVDALETQIAASCAAATARRGRPCYSS